jgi:hypothetical protein
MLLRYSKRSFLVDLIGRRTGEGGGTVSIQIDGKPGDKASAFFLSAIEPREKNHVHYNRGSAGDAAPHDAESSCGPTASKQPNCRHAAIIAR